VFAQQIVCPKIPLMSRCSPLQPQVIVHRDLDILLRAQVALGGLDRGVPQQELDLLQIPAVLPAQFGACRLPIVNFNC
jgi:hypothetical protein